MTLGIQTQINDGTEESQFQNIVKYQSEAGRFFLVDRVGGANGFESVLTEIKSGTQFAIDFGSIEVGWVQFSSLGPSFHLAPLGRPMPPRPNKEHKQGFKVMILFRPNEGGLREFATSAKTLTGPMDDLHTRFEQAPEAQQGKIPVVEFAGSVMLRLPGGGARVPKTVYPPTWNIVQWIDRPSAFGPRTVAPPGGPAGTAPAPAPVAPKPPNGGMSGAARVSQARTPAPPPRSTPAEVAQWQEAGGAPKGIPTWEAPKHDSLDDEIPF